MTAKTKHPACPKPAQKEIPFEADSFKAWCVDQEGMSQRSATVYVSRIRAALRYVFEGKYETFDVLPKTLKYASLAPQPDLIYFDKTCEYIDNLIDLMALLPAKEFFESKHLKYSEKTLSEWVSAFRTYSRFFQWQLDRICQRRNLPTRSFLKSEDKLPLKTEFAEYLSRCRYTKKSIYTYVYNITQINNFFFKFISDDFDILHEMISRPITNWDEMNKLRDALLRRIAREIRLVEQDSEDKTSICLTKTDLTEGRTALLKYFDFLKERFKQKNPDNLTAKNN